LSRNLLAEALAAAKIRYAARCPGSLRQWQDATRAMPGGNTRSILYFDPFPLCMVSGEGCHLTDIDGHRYVDLLGEYTAGIYGHSSPVIQEAVGAALTNGISLSAQTIAEAKLSRLIQERFPALEALRFANSGTEANLLAVATAIAFTRRRRVLVFEGAYHGSLLKFSGGASPINVPHQFVIAPYNDAQAARTTIRAHARELACVLVEPMLGAGGCIPGDPRFLEALAEETQAVGAVLIFDEIQTSRLSIGGRQGLLGLKPDLTTLGKYFGGGLSFGAFGGRSDLMALFDPRIPGSLAHAGTFNNNVLSMAAGCAGLSLLTAATLEKLNARGDALRLELNSVLQACGARLAVRGLGSLMNFHATSGAADAAAAISLLFFELMERGYYLAPRGFIALSLPLDDDTLAHFVDSLREVLIRHAPIL
jgi:glutamate-1-semialdehyde 2,1-aminomutase